jgi:hypothetical protein
VRPLIGSDEQKRLVCGPCAGAPGLDYTCRECGRGGQIHSERRCFGCVLGDRTRILLTGPGGDVSDLEVPLPRRPAPVRLLAEDDHIRQLDRCLTDEAMPLDLRAGGALVLLFGMLISRVTQLTKDNVVEDGKVTYLAVDGHRLMLPTRLAELVRQLCDQDEPRWTLGRLGTPAPWLFPGQSPARPAADVVFGVRLHRYGIDAHAGRNAGRLALAAELPASVLADLTGISISTAERWSHWAKRDWAAYVAERSYRSTPGVGR